MQKKLAAGLGALAAFLMGSAAASAHQGAAEDQARSQRGGWSFVAGSGAAGTEAGAVEAPIVVATNSSSNTSSNSSSNTSSNSSSNRSR